MKQLEVIIDEIKVWDNGNVIETLYNVPKKVRTIYWDKSGELIRLLVDFDNYGCIYFDIYGIHDEYGFMRIRSQNNHSMGQDFWGKLKCDGF